MTTIEKAQRLIRAATGEDYGDGYIVMDIGEGYAEPGYPGSWAGMTDVWVTGDWNPKRFPHGDEPQLTKAETVGPRLAEALERIGVHTEWYDEWARCDECYELVRTQPDSYSWKPSYAWQRECAIVCHNCLLAQGDAALDEYLNDTNKCVTWASGDHLESLGFVRWNDDRYQNGWYPGQNDDPKDILQQIRDAGEEGDVVFLLDSTGQFDISFSAYVRTSDES